MKVLKDACPNCHGTLKYYPGKYLVCTNCYRKEDISTQSAVKIKKLESMLTEINNPYFFALTKAGKFFLRMSFEEMLKTYYMLRSLEDGAELTDEKEIYLKSIGMLEDMGEEV
jgi:uncharacterized Zn finger protein (UPF0148 family)